MNEENAIPEATLIVQVLQNLSDEFGDRATPHRQKLETAFDRLLTLIEDLRVSQEELYRQNQELAIAYQEETLRSQQIQSKLEAINQNLEVTTEELESSNEHLKEQSYDLELLNQELWATNEQLQTMNQEMQTANEELETVNGELEETLEELNCSREELEMANEELETVNQELQITNAELQQRTNELSRVQTLFESFLRSIPIAVVIVDRNFYIQTWNRSSEELWGMWSQEAEGQHLLNLDIGLPVEQLRQSIRDCLSGQLTHCENTLTAINRRGKTINCRVVCAPLIDSQKAANGALVLIEATPIEAFIQP